MRLYAEPEGDDREDEQRGGRAYSGQNKKNTDSDQNREAKEREALLLELSFRRFAELASLAEDTELVRVEDRRTTDIGCQYARWEFWDADEGRLRHHELMYAVALPFLRYWRTFERLLGQTPETVNDPRARRRAAVLVLECFYKDECARLEHLLAQAAGEWCVE